MHGTGAPPAKKTPWGWILGCGCGGCLLISILIGVVLFTSMRQAVNKTPLPASQSAYVGTWNGDDGSTLTIAQNGSGTYESTGSTNTRITNGQVTIDESAGTLKVGIFGIDKEWKITEPPSGDRMVLDQTVFTRGAGASFDEEPGSYTNTPGSGVPPTDELNRMNTMVLLALNTAIQTQDFETFYNEELSQVWKNSTSPAELQTTFQDFIDRDINLSPIAEVEPVIETGPTVDERGIMTVAGYYPTAAGRVVYQFKYIQDEGNWKLFGISVETK